MQTDADSSMVCIMLKLKGKNQIEALTEIAERLAAEISRLKDVVGIVFSGGLARGFMDKHSDIDIIVYMKTEDKELKRRIRKISAEEQKLTAVDLDVEVHSFDAFRKRRWSEIDKWSFSNSRVVFDATGEVTKVLEKKLTVSKEFWVRRIAICSEYMKWYSCSSKASIGTMTEAWIDRGDVISAHYCLSYSVDILLVTLYALNKEFLPPPKWRIYYLYRLKWLPKRYDRQLREAMIVKELSEADLHRRLKAIQGVWRQILPKCEEVTGLDAGSLSRFYVEKVLNQA